MAICTNNVREWSARWQAMIPVAELFDVVIDSSELGVRKPDPRIYHATLAALGVAPEAAVFIDDMQINCEAATALGMRAVWFQETEQAIADVEAALDGDGDRPA
jgi:epoxide hydrolase-like predicted phosphatase